MKTTLHGHHVDVVQRAEHKLAFMSRYSRYGKIGNFGIRYHRVYLDFVGQVAQAGAQNNANTGFEGSFAFNVSNGFIDFLQHNLQFYFQISFYHFLKNPSRQGCKKQENPTVRYICLDERASKNLFQW
ncbi:MAG: hypothetical protein BWY70_01414 [Bacteroidetes bacterium ADurb.Bin408]|nr:MAG: hypothetical protein BWY70_01414 [Bacteroidetes bacterium ADurb.Bin408]